MQTLTGIISDELKKTIELELLKEEELIKNHHEGTKCTLSEMEYFVGGDIFNEYSQIPLANLSDAINKLYPFVKELDLTIVPYIEFEYEDSTQSARAYVSHFFLNIDKNLTDDQISDLRQLYEELGEFYDDLGIKVSVYFEEEETDGVEDTEDEDDYYCREVEVSGICFGW